MDQDQVAENWAARGFSCGLWVDPPGQVWADFVHDVDELMMLVEGEIELEFGGNTLRPQVGEEIRIPAGTNHTVRNIGTVTSRWLYGYNKMQTEES